MKKATRQPQVLFMPAPISMDADLICGFLGTDWAKYVIRRHPQLKAAAKVKNEIERKKMVSEYLKKGLRVNVIRQNSACKRFAAAWNKDGLSILKQLVNIIGTDWPIRRHRIVAYVSMNPISPRFLDSWSFSISTRCRRGSKVRRIVSHEVSHFLHFNSLIRSQPNIDRSTFEVPHRNWFVSELAVVPLLNDPRVQRYIGEKEKPYPEHLRLRVQKRTLPSIVNKLYRQHVRKDNDYHRFIEAVTALLKQNNI